MSTTVAGVIFILSLIAALAVAYRYLGDYMYRAVAAERHNRVERGIYKLVGVDPNVEQSWGVYARSVLAFSLISILFLYAFLRLQDYVFPGAGPALSAGINDRVFPHLAWNTAVSFVTNTNWQAYSGENTMTHVVQMAGLAVQNFASAAVGIAVAVALVRGFARRQSEQLGNFWVDLTRITLRILLPFSAVAALLLILGGAVQNLSDGTLLHTLAGAEQHITGGAVASQEAIKEFGTNGGGFYNVNSAHPFENPTSWTNWLEIFLLLVIPFALPRVFGRMVKDNRQGYAILAVMAIIAIASVALTNVFELQHMGTVPQAVGAAFEGKDIRFGIPDSATFASATTLTSTGSVNSFHDSYTALGGMMPIINMMLGEVAPGGTGSGLYGMLILAVITVFVAGLMVGRTPEYLGKKVGAREMKFASVYFLVTPTIVLIGVAAAMATGNWSTQLNVGPHGFSEVVYAFTSAANNNGSAFAGITVNTPWWNTALGLAMLLGRFLPLVFVLGLAGSLARQKATPASAGTLPTHKPLFIGMVVGVVVILIALTFLPALALGPLAEGL
ncbi:potassium-transporting ATPase subunit KdpA [Catellatospora tritici]|uniref:potassium-transporting ATPase subunit KdpA n=1 Tax=Catellatospora tritici TaxID=2851566 RepID=UPI001C2DE230|nr:potassium-transporting ATPase subunit KdpA [Catellatospora tritici]MBV1856262.1 potassium-transporting ATPase subunit KdpA [Catellatospora tritici]